MGGKWFHAGDRNSAESDGTFETRSRGQDHQQHLRQRLSLAALKAIRDSMWKAVVMLWISEFAAFAMPPFWLSPVLRVGSLAILMKHKSPP
jgi:hypothetical protein